MLTHPLGSRAMVLQLRETIGEDTGEGGGHGTNEIENGVSLLEFVSRIPAAEKIRTACKGLAKYD